MTKWLVIVFAIFLSGCSVPDMQETSEDSVKVVKFNYEGCSYLYMKRFGNQGYEVLLNPKQADPACKP